MIAELKMHQNTNVALLINFCRTQEHYNSMTNLLRNSPLPKSEKLTWFLMLKEKATSNGFNLSELFNS